MRGSLTVRQQGGLPSTSSSCRLSGHSVTHCPQSTAAHMQPINCSWNRQDGVGAGVRAEVGVAAGMTRTGLEVAGVEVGGGVARATGGRVSRPGTSSSSGSSRSTSSNQVVSSSSTLANHSSSRGVRLTMERTPGVASGSDLKLRQSQAAGCDLVDGVGAAVVCCCWLAMMLSTAATSCQ